jgi:hypothetical protein
MRWCNFSGTIPSEIGLLTNINYFQLQKNRFEGTLPEGINNLTKLSKLTRRGLLLGVFALASLKPAHMNRFAVLYYILLLTSGTLSIDTNFFTGTMPQAVCDLDGLGGDIEFDCSISCECCKTKCYR